MRTERSRRPRPAARSMQMRSNAGLPEGSRFQYTSPEMDLLPFKRNPTPHKEAKDNPTGSAVSLTMMLLVLS